MRKTSIHLAHGQLLPIMAQGMRLEHPNIPSDFSQENNKNYMENALFYACLLMRAKEMNI